MRDTESKIIKPIEGSESYTAHGLIDLQVNGIKGVDFNDTSLTEKGVRKASKYLLSRGITTYFPTIITNSDEHVLSLIRTVVKACETCSLVEQTIGGIHLERSEER